MLTVWQRVNDASVTVNNQIIGRINQGLIILCGFAPGDNLATLNTFIDKCLNYRIFEDENGKMNLSLSQINGGLFLVPQFTLLADTRRGLRPSFSQAASPNQGQALFEQLIRLAKSRYHTVESGEFGADMQVSLCNDGPVTFVMSF